MQNAEKVKYLLLFVYQVKKLFYRMNGVCVLTVERVASVDRVRR